MNHAKVCKSLLAPGPCYRHHLSRCSRNPGSNRYYRQAFYQKEKKKKKKCRSHYSISPIPASSAQIWLGRRCQLSLFIWKNHRRLLCSTRVESGPCAPLSVPGIHTVVPQVMTKYGACVKGLKMHLLYRTRS